MKINFPELEEWQKEVFRTYLKYKNGKWVVIKSKRQVGKSICLALLLLYVSLTQSKAQSLVISPVMSQSRKIYKDIKKILDPRLGIKTNDSMLTMEFQNGSEIEFCSAEQGDTIRGKTVKRGGILCVDEAAYIKDDFFYEVLLATTNVANSDIFITSTPKFKQGFFFTLFQEGKLGSDKVISIDWNNYDTSKFLSDETLELYRQKLPHRAFTSEYLALFLDGDSVIFGDTKRLVTHSDVDIDLPLYVGIDWGTGQGQDFTVLSPVQLCDGLAVVYQQIAFNEHTTNETIDEVMNMVQKYVQLGVREINIVVEKNSIGQVYWSLLFDKIDQWEEMWNDSVSWQKEIEVNVMTFVTSNSSKKRIIEQLSNLFEKDLITCPDDEHLHSEFETYECKVDKNGTVTYNAAPGFHDDRIMSLAIVVDQIYKDII